MSGNRAHIALARKYRPRLFSELIGQEHVARALRGAMEQNRVAHGYLFSGPRGVGKTTAARILAMALNCETRHAGKPAPAPGEPCGACPSCERIWAGSTSLDVVEIDAASNRGVDDARDLRERTMYAASQEGRHKVYIVDEAHMLTREAWNTLLKVLEEPPPAVVFVFATTEPHKITSTAAPVMSRLQRFDFRRVGPHHIAERLAEVARAEKIQADQDAVDLIARIANGGMRDALSVLDQVTAFGEGPVTAAGVREVLGLVGDESYAELLGIVIERRPADAFPFVAKLVEAGVDLVAFAEGAGDLWRAALAAKLGARPDGVSTALAAEIERRVHELAAGDLLRILRALDEADEPVRRGPNPRLALETLLVRWAVMDRTVDIAEVLKGGRAVDERPSQRVEMRDSAKPANLDDVKRRWPDVIAAVREGPKKFVAEALRDVALERLEGDVLTVAPLSPNPMTLEALERNRASVDAALARVLGAPVRLRLAGRVGGPEPPAPAAPKPQRFSVEGAKSERTRAFRGKDPALDSAMDALDLELLE